jgi:hypothetical protein
VAHMRYHEIASTKQWLSGRFSALVYWNERESVLGTVNRAAREHHGAWRGNWHAALCSQGEPFTGWA